MDIGQSFGGNWTEEKLNLLAKYLKAYVTIFTRKGAPTAVKIAQDILGGA
jgi:hypothetical protein